MKKKISKAGTASAKAAARLEASLTDAGISLENLRSDVSRAVAAIKLFENPTGNNLGGPWVRDLVSPDDGSSAWCAIISAYDGKTYEVNFTIEGGKVAVQGDPEEVISETIYTPAAEASQPDAAGRQVADRNGLVARSTQAGQLEAGDKSESAAAMATKAAYEATEDARQPAGGQSSPPAARAEMHKKAAEMHDAAAELQKKDGNDAMELQHKDKGRHHRQMADALSKGPESTVRSPAEAEAAAIVPSPESRVLSPVEAEAPRGDTRPTSSIANRTSPICFEAEVMTAMETPEIFDGFMAMAGGIQTMTLGCEGKPVTVTINVNKAGAEALQAQLEIVNKATPQKAFNCFFHEKKAASSWPKKFFYRGADAVRGQRAGIYEAAEPSEEGLKAVKGKTCRGFSLTFFTDAQLTPRPVLEGGGYEVLPGDRGSKENPAQIICPEDVEEYPTAYLNMGTMTNRPASIKNQPLFAGDVPGGSPGTTAGSAVPPREKRISAVLSEAARAGRQGAGADNKEILASRDAASKTNQTQTKIKHMKRIKQLDAAALQDRKTQLEQRIPTLEAESTETAKQELAAAQYELEEVGTLIELQAERAKVKLFEEEKTKALEASAQDAVEQMIEGMQIAHLDKELQASWKAKFVADPTLIPLIVKPVAGARRITPGAAAVELQAGGRNRGASEIDLGWSVPTEMKEMLRLTNLNARVRIVPGMTKSQMEAAYEEKGKFALKAGLLYKKSLKPHLDDWKDIPGDELAKCVGLEAGGMTFNRRAFEAADYLDPLNQFQTLSGTLVLQRTLPLYAYDYPELLSMFTDFSDTPGLYLQTEQTRVVNIPAVQLYNAGLDANGRPIGFVVASPASTVDAPLTLSAYIAVPIVIGQATLSATQRRLFDEQAEGAMKAIASYFVGMMTVLFTPGNFNSYAAVTAPDAQGVVQVPTAYATYLRSLQDWSMTDLDKFSAIFTQNKVPRSERGILLNTQYYAKLRSDSRLALFFAASKGDPQLTQQKLPDGLSGFFPYEAPYLPASVPFFPYQKAAIMLKSRLPMDFTQAVGAMIPGSITTVTEPDSKFSVALVQRVDLVGNYAEYRPEVQLGANVGDKRGGLCGATN